MAAKPRGRAIEKVAGGLPSYVLANRIDLAEEAQLWGEDLEAFCEGWGAPHTSSRAPRRGRTWRRPSRG